MRSVSPTDRPRSPAGQPRVHRSDRYLKDGVSGAVAADSRWNTDPRSFRQERTASISAAPARSSHLHVQERPTVDLREAGGLGVVPRPARPPCNLVDSARP